MIGFGLVAGDWEKYQEESKKIYILEPVAEGILQLFVQSIILYIMWGTGGEKRIDLTALAYEEPVISKLLYILLLVSVATNIRIVYSEY